MHSLIFARGLCHPATAAAQAALYIQVHSGRSRAAGRPDGAGVGPKVPTSPIFSGEPLRGAYSPAIDDLFGHLPRDVAKWVRDNAKRSAEPGLYDCHQQN
jgi:hypothetical protein